MLKITKWSFHNIIHPHPSLDASSVPKEVAIPGRHAAQGLAILKLTLPTDYDDVVSFLSDRRQSGRAAGTFHGMDPCFSV